MAAAITPVTAPAPAPSSTPGQTGASRDAAAAAAARTTINVSELPSGMTPAAPPTGSARARLGQDLRKRFGGEEPTPAPAAPAERPGSNPPGAETPADLEAAAAAETPPEGQTPPKPGEGEKGKKMSPWKLVDQFKARATQAEARILELEKQVVPEAKARETSERIAAYEKRIQEMQEDLRFHNAEKYDPDVIKAHTEYEGAWKRAMGELKELSITDPGTGQPRPIATDDMLELVNLSLPQAREVAEKLFGPFANDVMAHRKEIRNLFESKANKLAELKKSGSTRDQERAEKYQSTIKEIDGFIQKTYDQAIGEAVANPQHGVFLKPQEGNAEWNTKLEKATKLVDESLSMNARDPRLSPEQRAEATRRYVAVRNRAIAYSTLRHENGKLKTDLAAIKAELAKYQETTPAAGGRGAPTAQEAPRGMAAIRAGLAKIAH